MSEGCSVENINWITAKIKAFRNLRGYSQEKMAELLGIEQTTYSNWENQKVDLTLKNIQRIADVLEIDVREIWDETKFVRRAQPKKTNYKSPEPDVLKVMEDEIEYLKDANRTLTRALKELLDERAKQKT